MKLFSRKGFTAVVAAVTLSAASITAPAMAAEAPQITVVAQDAAEDKAPVADKDTNTDNQDDTAVGSSFDSDSLKGLKDFIAFITDIGKLFGGLTALIKNLEDFIKTLTS